MLKSSEFNSAVPKFTNGNYASTPLDPANIEEPTMQDYVRGVEPLETLPAQWWNWLCNQFTSRFNKLNTYVKNIFDELTQLLSLVNVTPDGTESTITTGQLKNAFKELYPTYVSDKLELGTTYVKQTTTVNGHALSGNVTVSKSDVGLDNVPNVSTNDQTPTYTEASTLTALSSGEKLSIAFGKLAKAVSSLISHINNTNNPHSVTKAQVQLGDVVNTGDSATPVENGTTKFTTGGAYTELGKKINGNTISYVNNLSTIPTNKYILIFERSAPANYYNLALHLIGEFGNISGTDKQFFNILIDFRNAQNGVILNAVTNKYQNIFDVIATWDNNTNTARVYLEIKTGYASASVNAIDGMSLLSTLTASSSMLGTPSAMTFLSQYTIVQKNVKDSLAPFFRTSVAYAVGDYVLYNSLLYKCTTAHSAGAWNSSHFTVVTVGNELEALDNKIDENIDIESNLPTDAVLHYSFDDVPDYPDGTAVYFRNKNFTSADNWQGNATISYNNGVLELSSQSEGKYAYKSVSFSNSVVKLCITANIDTTVVLYSTGSTSSNLTITLKASQKTEIVYYFAGSSTSIGITNINGGVTISVEAIYIGDGSYSTPIIDNANGEWNSVSQSCVAVQGVSGKAIRFLGNNYIKGNLPWKPHDKKVFTVSGWFKNWDKTTNLHFINDWITQAVANFMIELDPTDTLSLAFDVPTDDGCKRFGVNKTILNWNNYSGDVFLTGVFNGDNSKFYVNGISFPLTLRSTASLSDTIKSRDVFEIGRLYGSAGGSNGSIATIDDLLIFDRTLTETEVKALYYNKANTPKYFIGSDLPAPSGNIPFTTGGIYNLLTSLAPAFSTESNYFKGQLVYYNGKIYVCTDYKSAGDWDGSKFTEDLNNSILDTYQYMQDNLVHEIRRGWSYKEGEIVTLNNEQEVRPGVTVKGPNLARLNSDYTVPSSGDIDYSKFDKARVFSSPLVTTECIYGNLVSVESVDVKDIELGCILECTVYNRTNASKTVRIENTGTGTVYGTYAITISTSNSTAQTTLVKDINSYLASGDHYYDITLPADTLMYLRMMRIPAAIPSSRLVKIRKGTTYTTK